MNSDSASNSVYASNANISQSQWYTGIQNSMTNINFTPDREIGNRSFDSFTERSNHSNSRPESGHYSHHRASIQSQLSVFNQYNPSIISITNSKMNINDDDEIPPPLPVKQSFTESIPLKDKVESCQETIDENNHIYQ